MDDTAVMRTSGGPRKRTNLVRSNAAVAGSPTIVESDGSVDSALSTRGGGASLVTTFGARSPWMDDLLHRLVVGFYFGLWYALNIVYNSTSKWFSLQDAGIIHFPDSHKVSPYYSDSCEQEGTKCVGSTDDCGVTSVGHWRFVRRIVVDTQVAFDANFGAEWTTGSSECWPVACDRSALHHVEFGRRTRYVFAHRPTDIASKQEQTLIPNGVLLLCCC